MSRAACGPGEASRVRPHGVQPPRVVQHLVDFHASAGRLLQRIAAPASRRWSAFRSSGYLTPEEFERINRNGVDLGRRSI
jgi:hypothetical protein